MELIKHCNKEIDWRGAGHLYQLEIDRPGTLLNNCSYELWRERYVTRQEVVGKANPLRLKEPLSQRMSLTTKRDQHRHISQHAVQLSMTGGVATLFGCTEDMQCDHADVHMQELEQQPYMRRLCEHCRLPVCTDCWDRLYSYEKGRRGIPMSLANDHYCGYVDQYLVEHRVTWLECAAASVVWTTMLVYYLEDPHGHLMGEKMGGAQARTHVRGNVFSFNMPWRDIMESCEEAIKNGGAVDSSLLQDAEREVGVPHFETTLAQLVHRHIRGGTKDLADHLKGLTMRVHVIDSLIKIMHASGYPG